ncbi:hypothetical protein KO504_06595, partial [Winogradskyella psychrotolerans]|uniref:tetratricopeptide repeat protein n=2 Tax=Winogradskyella psychrotolerans TaxID=1344585 RepID=UPI00339D8753|nr:hypothetical protein [Winogradskyella psychrotolerans]
PYTNTLLVIMKNRFFLLITLLSLFSCISNQNTEINAIIDSASKSLKDGHPTVAVNSLEEAIIKFPQNTEILYELYFIYNDHIKDTNKANGYLKQYCLIKNSSSCYNQLAYTYELLNNIDSAVVSYKKSIKLDTLNPIPHLELGVIYKKYFQNKKLALSHYLKSYELNLIKDYPEKELQFYNNDFSTILYNIGNTYYFLGQYNESNQYLFEGLKYKVDKVIMLNSIANNYMRLERPEEALKYYDKTLNADSTYVYAINGKGNALHTIGETDKACEYWSLALKKGYNYQEKWLEEYAIIDPNLLIEENCK